MDPWSFQYLLASREPVHTDGSDQIYGQKGGGMIPVLGVTWMLEQSRLDTIFSYFRNLDKATEVSQIVDLIAYCMKHLAFDGCYLTGIPLPNQSLSGLVLLDRWLEDKLKFEPGPDDIIFKKSTDWPTAFVLKTQFHAICDFAKKLSNPGRDLEILIIPILAVKCYQGVLVCRFSSENVPGSEDDQALSYQERSLLTTFVNTAMVKIASIQPRLLYRPGELTSREKEVLSLSSLGYTSQQVAQVLKIRERTVVTHIQNASQKLAARNRTECVLHGIRYQQIGPGAGLGFYQIEHEIFDCPKR